MSNSFVRCRCGHRVLAKEILRTDLYERGSGRDYVYLKFRCARCKRLGQTFIPETRWDWAMLEAAPNEMTAEERDRFLDEEPISATDLLQLHFDLQEISFVTQLHREPGFSVETPHEFPLVNEVSTRESSRKLRRQRRGRKGERDAKNSPSKSGGKNASAKNPKSPGESGLTGNGARNNVTGEESDGNE